MLTAEFNLCLQQIRNGDTNGIMKIYNEYYEKMKFTALAKVKNIQTAQDIASEFIKYILENTNKIGYVKNPSAWIYKCINNQSINYIRKESKTISIEDFNEEHFARSRDFDLYYEVVKCYKDLPENEQELVLLHFVYGFKYKEISKMISRPEGTIKRQIHEIKEKLEYLKKYL